MCNQTSGCLWEIFILSLLGKLSFLSSPTGFIASLWWKKKILRLVTDHTWVWNNRDELEGAKKKKRKVRIITSQLNINHYKDKRKGAACRNLQEIQVFSDFLPPLCRSAGLRCIARTGTVNNLHICWMGFPAIDERKVD